MSVGQAQRVLIAMAVMHRPALLIADEATSALDVITQSEILALFRDLNRSTGMAILYISHDLASVAGICDRIAILHRGEIVECGTTEQIFAHPQHEPAVTGKNRSCSGAVSTPGRAPEPWSIPFYLLFFSTLSR